MIDVDRDEPLPDPEQERAVHYALRVLGYRARSADELRRQLQRKGFTPPAADYALQRLHQLGLLDDREFARSWVTSRVTRGPMRLRYELRQKGIAPEIAEESILSFRSVDDDLATAWRLARKAWRGDGPARDPAALRKVWQMLQRRGFTREVIAQVCARLGAAVDAEGDWLD